jgi:catechol 2,3-dioxygenase-like lactoylglutathione lyase family enzyme
MIRRRARPAAALAGLLAVITIVPGAARAAPVAESELGPVDVRRTTLVVRNVDRALTFYRDALGLTVVYDQEIVRPPQPDDVTKTERRMRLALLRANDDFIGVIGLLEYTAPRMAEPSGEPQRPGIGDVILVINAADLDQRFEKVRTTPGVRIATEPFLTSYPSPDGKGTIPVRVSAVWDPDGYFVELNQLLGTAAGTESR